MGYGMNFNMAVTSDGDKATCGIHVTDSTGLDISHEEVGDSFLDAFTKACHAASSDVDVVTNARKLQAEKKAAENRKKNEEKLNIKRKKVAALRKEAEKIQKEIDELQSESKSRISRDDYLTKAIAGLDSELNEIFKSFF